VLSTFARQDKTTNTIKKTAMKILKRILLGIGAVIAILLLTALFVSKDYKVEEKTIVNKPKNEVFNYVKFVRNQDNFNKWITSDPQIKKSYRGTDGNVGFVYAWDSEGDAGKGEQEIKNIQDGERVDLGVHFIKPMEGNAATSFITDALAANQTKVTWRMEGKSSYPFNIMNLFVPGLLGKDMQTSLTALKTALEKQ
jgi:hypothetical protein